MKPEACAETGYQGDQVFCGLQVRWKSWERNRRTGWTEPAVLIPENAGRSLGKVRGCKGRHRGARMRSK